MIFKLIQSTLFAMLGVQKRSNLEHDFQQKSALPFIISGVIGGVLFVLTIIGVVRLVLWLVAPGINA